MIILVIISQSLQRLRDEYELIWPRTNSILGFDDFGNPNEMSPNAEFLCNKPKLKAEDNTKYINDFELSILK